LIFRLPKPFTFNFRKNGNAFHLLGQSKHCTGNFLPRVPTVVERRYFYSVETVLLFAAIVFSLVYPLFTIEAWGNIFSFLRKGYAAEVIIGQPAMSLLAAESSAENNFWLTHWEISSFW